MMMVILQQNYQLATKEAKANYLVFKVVLETCRVNLPG